MRPGGRRPEPCGADSPLLTSARQLFYNGDNSPLHRYRTTPLKTLAPLVALVPHVGRSAVEADSFAPVWQVLDRAPVAILCLDPDLRITRANRAALVATG